jgi:tetratricopeptide (TPR) repeat protein
MNLENEIIELNNKGVELSDLCKYDEALSNYEKAIDLDPNRLDSWIKKADVLSNLGRYDEALSCYDKVIELDPNRIDSWIKKADVLSNLGRYDEALSCYDKAGEFDQTRLDPIVGKGNVLSILGRYDEAIIYYDRAIKLNPNYSLSWVGKGEALFELGNYQESIKCYDIVLEIDRNYPIAWSLDDKGKSLSVLGRNEEAIKFHDLAIKSDQKNVDSWVYKGIVLQELNRPEEATLCFDQARNIDSEYPIELAWNNKGEALFIKGKYNEAIKYYDEALRINPKKAESWYNKGLALFQLNDFKEAIIIFDKALVIRPNYAEVLFYKGVALYDLENYREALDCFDKALELDPTNIYSLVNKGNALEKITLEDSKKYSANYSLAISCYNKAISINPNFPAAWYCKGRVHYELGKYKEAIEYSSKAIELDENYSLPLLIKGKSLLANGEYLKAKDCFERSLELNKDETEAMFQLGLIYSEYLFDAETTLKYLYRILEISPNNILAKANMAEALIKLRRYDEARDICNEILEKMDDKEKKCIMIFLLLVSYQMKNDDNKSAITFNDFLDYYNSFPDAIIIKKDTWVFDGIKKFIDDNCIDLRMKFLLLTLIDLLQGRIDKKAFSFFYGGEYIKIPEEKLSDLIIKKIRGFLSS